MLIDICINCSNDRDLPLIKDNKMIKVLNDRYEIKECLEKESNDKPEVWKGYSCSDDDNETYTFKIWRYKDAPH